MRQNENRTAGDENSAGVCSNVGDRNRADFHAHTPLI